MQVQIKGETKQLNVQTITLQPEEGNNLYGFHCLNCGNFHQKIGGKVSKIYPIYEPSDQVPAISRCRNCGQEYNFQTHDGYSSDKIKVILHPIETKYDNNNTNYFFCYKGKDLILEYTSNNIYSHIEKQNKKTPFFSNCKSPDCKTIYYFAELV